MTNPIKSFLSGLKPIEVLSVDQWADKYRRLTSESSAESGQWRTDRAPFLRQVMQDLSPTSIIQEVVVMKGVQLGFTEVAYNVIGCFSDIDPCGIFYVLPTAEMAESASKKRLQPMIDNIPQLLKKIGKRRDRDSGNNILSKIFPGGSIELLGAGSPAKLSSTPVRVLALDEIDRYPLDVGGEGSPIKLAVARTSTFQNKKIYMLSTPTVDGNSAIQREIEDTDWNEFHVPCPHCGVSQVLVWEQMKWEEGKPETAKYQCVHCDELIEERYKTKMLGAGVWIPRFPERRTWRKRGYHINSLYSPYGWLSWEEIVKLYLEAYKNGDPTLIKTFVNTILGLPYKDEGEAPPYQNIYNRRESYMFSTVPSDVAFITAGVDIQKNRIEMEVVGWCFGKRSYSIDYYVLPGDTDKPEVWNELEKKINKVFIREDDMEIPIWMTAIDTGYNTNIVYNFCRRFDASKVMAVDGRANLSTLLGTPSVVDKSNKGKKIGGLMLWPVGIDIIKSEFYSHLRKEMNEDGTFPDGYCHFPQYDLEHFKRLTSETLVTEKVNKTGQIRTYWKKNPNIRNEQLDCRVYARAAASMRGLDRMTELDFQRLKAGYITRRISEKAVKKNVEKPKDDFWSRQIEN